ncbi:hypothetical protein D7V97_19080 [Corallococcus sp. CA053C]|nr:hypothetical protein D7V97_19080 [Corallococcus sp. CA053C]
MLQSTEHGLIQDFYGQQRARRSQVPFMNHIHEGLAVMLRTQIDGIMSQTFPRVVDPTGTTSGRTS